jgi:hypothetical protein
MALKDSFYNALYVKNKKGWKYLYIAVDVHGTILRPNYSADETPTEFYPNALKGMQLLSSMQTVKLIMYTSSTPEDIEKYNTLFLENGIKFDFFNENTDVPSEGFGFFDRKPYFNMLLDDKAGFVPETIREGYKDDWTTLIELVQRECASNMFFFYENFVNKPLITNN